MPQRPWQEMAGKLRPAAPAANRNTPAGSRLTTSETIPLPLCGVKVAEMVQAAPMGWAAATLHPLEGPATTWKSALSVWLTPVAARLPTSVKVPEKVADVLVPKS